jgi:hypothetical protein
MAAKRARSEVANLARILFAILIPGVYTIPSVFQDRYLLLLPELKYT